MKRELPNSLSQFNMQILKKICKENNITTKAPRKDDLIKAIITHKQENPDQSITLNGQPISQEHPHHDQQLSLNEATILPSSDISNKNKLTNQGISTTKTQPIHVTTDNYLPMNNTIIQYYYLPIHANNLIEYLNIGYIYPINCDDNLNYKINRSVDYQTTNPDILILSKELALPHENEILIELVLPENLFSVSDHNSLCYTSAPIPISRIRNLYFQSNDQINSIAANIRTWKDAVISPHLFKLIPLTTTVLKLANLDNNLAKSLVTTTESQLLVFDKLLGMCAYLKALSTIKIIKTPANDYVAGDKYIFDTYSDYLLGLICYMNTGFRASLSKESENFANFILAPNKPTTKSPKNRPVVQYRFIKLLIEEIINTSAFVNSFASVIYEKFQDVASDYINSNPYIDTRNTNQLIERHSNIKYIETIVRLWDLLNDHITPTDNIISDKEFSQDPGCLTLFLLHKFPKRNTKSATEPQQARRFLAEHSKHLEQKATNIAIAIYGAHIGYKRMYASDHQNFNTQNNDLDDILFNRLNYVNLKFSLENRLDRYIIETCYLYATTGTNPFINDYKYLNELDESLPTRSRSVASNTPKINHEYYLDSGIYVVKEQTFQDAHYYVVEIQRYNNLIEQYIKYISRNRTHVDVINVINSVLETGTTVDSLESLAKKRQIDTHQLYQTLKRIYDALN